MSQVPAGADGPNAGDFSAGSPGAGAPGAGAHSDGELIEAVRNGSSVAYSTLYERHVQAARTMARQLVGNTAEADDLVSEAFAKLLNALRSGTGPKTAFRAYLLTTVRHTAYDLSRRDQKLRLAEDVSEVADVGVTYSDTAVADLERSLIAQAFARLPERWQTVLWHVEVEGDKPSDIAPMLGLSANGVSALAYRAREGLRQAYLQVHVGQLDTNDPSFEQCRAAVDRLGSWTRNALSKRETAQVDAHLDSCERCRALAIELSDINGALQTVIGPIVLGSSVGTYLALNSGAGTAAAATGSAGIVSTTTAAPRQLTTTGLSCAAMVAAVAIALASAPEPPRPLAVQPPAVPPAPQPPRTPPKPAPPPTPPEVEVPPPPPTPRPAPRPVPPPPGQPQLDASGPGTPISLVAGGDPEAVPITIRNTGSARSEPVSVAVSLPPGVLVEAPAAPGDVECDSTESGLRCTSAGLAPGESITFDFTVRATEEATGGEIIADVQSGEHVELRLPAIPVQVHLPDPVDGVDVEVAAHDQAPWVNSRIRLEVHNTGTSTAVARAVAQIPESVLAIGIPPECEVIEAESAIRCADELAPGESFEGRLVLTALPEDHDERGVRVVTIPITATLGEASDSDSADTRLRFPNPDCPDDEDVPEP